MKRTHHKQKYKINKSKKYKNYKYFKNRNKWTVGTRVRKEEKKEEGRRKEGRKEGK
jgi:hypothetical protein